jgi:cytochrome b561
MTVRPSWFRRRLPRIRRHLHWWTAALVLLGFTIAWIMAAVPVRELLLKFLLFQLHKSLGLCVAALALARLALAWRARDLPRGSRAWLYVLLLVVPALGYLTAAAAPIAVPTLFFLVLRIPHVIAPDQALFDTLRPVHEYLAIGLIALAAWHAIRVRSRATGSPALRMARSADAHPSAEP